MRTIDADAIIKRAEESFKNAGLHGEDYRKFKKWLRAAPTIDAVEVVRCKNCKHWHEWENATGSCLRSENGCNWFGTDAMITAVLEKEKMIVNKKCGTCVFHKTDEHGEWYCGNQRSDYYCDYTDYNDTCIDWQKRPERNKNEID